MKKLYLGALALCMMASCQNEDAAVLDTQHVSKMEITASLDNSVGSRTALLDDGNGGYKVIWTEGDLLSVFYGSSDAHNQFELNTGAGETTATFKSVGSFVFSSDTENGDNSFANVGYYPYSASTTVSKNNDTYVINTEIPVNQTYAESSFAQNASPMVAVSNGLDFAFKNVASVLRVPLKGNKEIIKATLTAPSNMAGAATVTLTETNGNWMPSANVEDGSAMVVLNCSTPVQLNTSTATDFFFVLAPGTYAAGMVVKFYASDGTYYSYTTQDEQIFNRSEVKYLEDKIYGTEGTGHSNGTVGVSEANDELANGVENVEVTITSNDNDPTLELPATTSDNPTNINFTSLPEGKKITIQASTESQGGEAENVNLTVPQNANGYDFNINLPNSTVTLNANEGQEATYNEVTAATAENTLIIGEGVTVKNLKIKKGHVRVRGTVNNISRTDNSDPITYFVCEGELLNDPNLSDNIVYISAAEYDLRKAVENGGTVVLKDNITLTDAIKVTKDVTVDLNGKTLTSAGDGFEVTAGTLTLTGNGNVIAGTEGGTWVAVWANGGNAVIENGTYHVVSGKDGSTNDCIYAKLGGQITINGGIFSNAGTYVANMGGVVVNANNGTDEHPEYAGKIIINGGTFKPAEGCVAYEVADVEAGRVELKNAVTNESELKIAVAAGKNVKLGADIKISSAVSVTKDLTIDLNGKTLTSAGDGFEVTAGTLTLTGNGNVIAGTEGGTWVAVWANGGNAVIENGIYHVVSGKDGSTNDCIYAKLGGQITINGGIFSNAGTYVANMGGVVVNANNGTDEHPEYVGKIIINGGTFKPAEGCVAYEVADVEAGRVELKNAVTNESELKIAVAAGKNVKLGADIKISSAVSVTKDLTIDLNGKTLTSAGDGFEVTAGTLTLTGNGNVIAGTEGGTWVAVWANGGNAVIENGIYHVVSGQDGSTNDCIYAKGGQITINDGIFSNVGTYVANMGGVVINANNDEKLNSKVIINGGTFKPAVGCVAYEQKDVEAGRIELNNPVANESELKIAVAAGKNVKLGADIKISSAVSVTKDLTIDLNGKTLTSVGDGFEVTAGTLTLTGNGNVIAGTEGGTWVAVWANGGNAVIENGTYHVVSGQDGSTNDCIYAKGGQIIINGGIFSNVGTYVANMGGVVINANNDEKLNSKVIINGGTFKPAEGCIAYEQKDVEADRVVLNNK